MDKFKNMIGIEEMYVTVDPVAITPTIVKYINDWYRRQSIGDFETFRGSLANVALSGDKFSEEVLGTLNRMINKEPIGDRYLLQLAWFIRDMEEKKSRKEESERIARMVKGPRRV